MPAHVKAKQDAEPRGPKLNGAITAAYVRLVTEEGHGVISRREALERAKQLNLDLVEVQGTANPPVCKLMDFHKEKFKHETKEKERAKSKSSQTLRNGENKEVRFTAKTESKDLKIKADTITRLMERGYRVKCTVLPSGKEEEDLLGLLSRILAHIEDVAVVESGPHVVDTKQAYIMVRHVKFSTKKSGKKAVKALDAVSSVQVAVTNEREAVKDSTQEKLPLHSDEWESTERSSDSESDLTIQQTKSKVTGGSEDDLGFDARRIPMENNNGFNPSQLKPFVSSQSQPSVVEVNRYAKQTEANRFPQNRERMSQQSTRNGSNPRAQFDSRQRQFNNATDSSSSSSGYGRSNSTRPASFDQRNSGAVGDNRRNVGPLPGHGAYRSSIPPSTDQRNSGAVGDNRRNLGPSPGHGAYRSSIPNSSTDQRNSGARDQTRNPSFFSSVKSVSASDSSAPDRSSGVSSATKHAGPGVQKSSKDVTLDKANNSPAAKSYGIFSKPKASSPGA